MNQNTANAMIRDPIAVVANFYAKSAPYSEFEVSATEETMGSPLVAAVDYDVEWSGGWNGTAFLGSAWASVRISLELTDMTTNRVIKSLPIHELIPSLGIGIKGFATDTGLDRGRARNQYTAMVRRGHVYRLALKLDLESHTVGVIPAGDQSGYGLDYSIADRGAWWNGLSVTLEKDATDLIANHGHAYLTGHGEGHNNTEAVTGLAIFFEDSPAEGADAENSETAQYLPGTSTLRPNFPNPASPLTTVAFSLVQPSHVSIKVFDVQGREVMTLLDEERGMGQHEVTLDAGRLPSGVYLYRLIAGSHVESRRLVVTK